MQGNICVVGALGDGTSKSVSANWSSPFEGDSIGSHLDKVGGLYQTGQLGSSGKGKTSVTTLQSTQVWEGNQPHSFTVNLVLYALSNPRKEVVDAIKALEVMQAPDLKARFPISLSSDDDSTTNVGRIPGEISINIGRSTIYRNCVISSVSVPLDGAKDRNGDLLSADVSLEVSTKTLINKDEIY